MELFSFQLLEADVLTQHYILIFEVAASSCADHQGELEVSSEAESTRGKSEQSNLS